MRLVKHGLQEFIASFKQLQGNPHYVALGMAVGIFVSLTPSFPFQTAIAVPLAFVLRGSKRAAAIGVWLSNPVTLPLCYLASYKTGMLIIGNASSFDGQCRSISELIKMGLDVTCAMIIGGALLGLLAGTAAYAITHKMVTHSQPLNGTANKKVVDDQ
jgi:hypothetical protein